MWQMAVSIYAFDALIQNPDRKFNNPNLFSRGDQIIVFDHELAFSFLLGILPSPEPWRLDRLPFLREHVFYKQLRGKEIELEAFTQTLAHLPDDTLPEIVAEVPLEWHKIYLEKTRRHLDAVAAKSKEFAEAIRRSLA